MLARVMGASALAITLNLYIMDHIRKTEFMRSESLRMAWSMLGWTGGPTLGVLLYTHFGIVAPHAAGASSSARVLLALFWYYRLGDNALIRPGKTRPANPLANIGRFVAQPRLRLAWLIAFGRSCFWTTFFVYGADPDGGDRAGRAGRRPAGLGRQRAAVHGDLLGPGRQALRRAQHHGAGLLRHDRRRCWLAGLCGERFAARRRRLPALLRLFFAIALDALGSTAFMRAVRSYERPQMSAVYRTYLDFSELLPPLVYSIVLAFFGLGAVFVTLGVFAAVCGLLAWRYLPKSM